MSLLLVLHLVILLAHLIVMPSLASETLLAGAWSFLQRAAQVYRRLRGVHGQFVVEVIIKGLTIEGCSLK